MCAAPLVSAWCMTAWLMPQGGVHGQAHRRRTSTQPDGGVTTQQAAAPAQELHRNAASAMPAILGHAHGIAACTHPCMHGRVHGACQLCIVQAAAARCRQRIKHGQHQAGQRADSHTSAAAASTHCRSPADHLPGPAALPLPLPLQCCWNLGLPAAADPVLLQWRAPPPTCTCQLPQTGAPASPTPQHLEPPVRAVRCCWGLLLLAPAAAAAGLAAAAGCAPAAETSGQLQHCLLQVRLLRPPPRPARLSLHQGRLQQRLQHRQDSSAVQLAPARPVLLLLLPALLAACLAAAAAAALFCCCFCCLPALLGCCSPFCCCCCSTQAALA
ncbi:hypothetical protein COO60DRAFT_515797 [Scenedesmus sp. NREL 46B-D3]|nr:hypothetical protein COO60DRAFT_515797 [Scenedesmus sp. NREL 46B-D3]